MRANFVDVWMHAIEAATGEHVLQAEIELTSRLDEALLSEALIVLLRRQPLLGYRLRVAGKQAYWESVPEAAPVPLAVAHTSGDYERLRDQRLRSDTGPQVSALLWRGETDRLLVKVAHQVADAGGLKLLLRMLAETYTAVASGATPETGAAPLERDGYRRVLRSIPRRAYFPIGRDTLGSTLREVVLKRSFLHLPIEIDADAPCEFVVRSLDRERVSALHTYARRHGATLNDVFLAAVWRALWQSRDRAARSFAVVVTVDLRQWYEAARTEGITNLVSAEVIRQGADPGADFSTTLDRVVRWSARRKKQWLGIANLLVLRTWIGAMPFEKLRASERRRHVSGQALPVFTNLGAVEPGDLDFAGVGVRSVVLFPPARLDGRMIGLSSYDGRLSLAAGVPASARGAMEAFFKAVFDELPAEQ